MDNIDIPTPHLSESSLELIIVRLAYNSTWLFLFKNNNILTNLIREPLSSPTSITTEVPWLHEPITTCSDQAILHVLGVHGPSQRETDYTRHRTLRLEGRLHVRVAVLGAYEPALLNLPLTDRERVLQVANEVHLLLIVHEVIEVPLLPRIREVLELLILVEVLQARVLYNHLLLIGARQVDGRVNVLVEVVEVPEPHLIVVRLEA